MKLTCWKNTLAGFLFDFIAIHNYIVIMSEEAASLHSAISLVSQDFIKILLINLTEDTFTILQNSKDDVTVPKDSNSIFHWLTSFGLSGKVHPEDKETYLKHTSREYLENYFQSKKQVWRLRYKRTFNNSFSLVQMEMRPTENFSPENRELYLYVQNMDSELSDLHAKEIRLQKELTEEKLLQKVVTKFNNYGTVRVYFNEDRSTNYYEMDSNFYKIFGFSDSTDFKNKGHSFWDMVESQDIKKLRRLLNNATEQNNSFDCTLKITNNLGKKIWINAMGQFIFQMDKPYLFVGIISDITEKIEFENMLQHKIQDNIKLEEYLAQLERERKTIKSIGSVYNSMHIFDLVNGDYQELTAFSEITEYGNSNKHHQNIQQLINGTIKITCTKEHLQRTLEFVDFTTLNQRLHDKKFISTEFLGAIHGWVRASFIPLERDEDGQINKVIFTTLVIDEQKRKEQQLINISQTDELTMLLNRRAFENTIQKLEANGVQEDHVFIEFDVNGLKRVNDNIGHAAGDDLIQGAASSILATFGTYGSIFRTGGDEFFAIINASQKQMEELSHAFSERCKKWKGKIVSDLSISLGYVCCSEFPYKSISDLERIADQRMYQDKSRFYRESGIERRRI